MPFVYEITNNWDDRIIIEQQLKKSIISYNDKKYEIHSDERIDILISENLDIISVYEIEDENIIVNINWEEIYKWKEEGFVDFVRQEGENIYFIIDNKEVIVEFYRGLNRNNHKSKLFEVNKIELSDYKKFIELWDMTWSNLKEENKKSVQTENYDIYSKLDSKLEVLYDKFSKKDLNYQMNTYKKLRVTIMKLQKKYTSWAQKELIDYLYEKINSKYKKVFKEYVISKKK